MGYEGIARLTHRKMERVAGIEPAHQAWEANRLPLHHTRLDAVFNPAALTLQAGRVSKNFPRDLSGRIAAR